MYILRPIARASLQRPPARLISGRRFRHSRSQTRLYSTDPSIPAGTDGKPVVDGSNDPLEDRKKGAAEASEQRDAGTTTEDPEQLTQNLQRSREMTRRYSSALKRTQRRNRARDLPPVVVPRWFLEEKVILHDKSSAHQAPPSSPKKAEITLSLKRQDEKQFAQCSIPISDPSMGVLLLDQWVSSAWHGDVSSERLDVIRRLVAEWGLPYEQGIINALLSGEDLDSTVTKLRESILEQLQALKVDLAQTKRLMKSFEDEQLVRMKQDYSRADAALTSSVSSYEALVALQDQAKNQPHVSPFTLAEIRATMAASLSALQPAINDVFPSTRTNLVLHAPFAHLDGLIHQTIRTIASELGADLVELSAQDLAELGGDYLGEGPDPFLHSIRSLGYETYKLSSGFGHDTDDLGVPETEYEDEAASNPNSSKDVPLLPQSAHLVIPLSSMLKNISQSLRSQHAEEEQDASSNDSQGRVLTQAEIQLEDLKISNLLEHLIDSIDVKRPTKSVDTGDRFDKHATPIATQHQQPTPKFFDPSIPIPPEINLFRAIPRQSVFEFDITANITKSPKNELQSSKSKIVYIQDFKELNATHYGSRIIQRLEEIVRKRRNAGESIMIVGSTCSRDLMPEFSVDGVQSIQAEGDASSFRSIVVPAGTNEIWRKASDARSKTEKRGDFDVLGGHYGSAERRKFSAINMRHIQNMLRALDPKASRQISLRSSSNSLSNTKIPEALFPESYCSRVMTHDEVHRVALMALGLHLIGPTCDNLKWTHVALAMSLLKASDEVKFSFVKGFTETPKVARTEEQTRKNILDWARKSTRGAKSADGKAREQRDSQLQKIAATADKYEKRLMPGIINPSQIQVGFDEVHVQPETVEAIRTLTSMSFLRPDAFSYGVLATEKISGALLYGPPGTGKTLLAKAVAKESGCAVLEVSGSQIHDKYVGEGEKNVTAIFSLARKLTPCIVFLDEADAVLSSRDATRDRGSARDILNQFLKEWDGLNNNSVFVMVATNRPFDLDDAVIRRLPRRLLIDLPTETDRKEILRIHLRGEQLDESVDIAGLAKHTPFYSGSDLKNVAVAAALACVKEENEQVGSAAIKAAISPGGPFYDRDPQKTPAQLLREIKFEYPEKRTLHARHFEKALQEISASVSEDMSSLNAIKKFDEKYGDKKGKKKKRVFGIGPFIEASEASARVRS